MNFKPVFIKGEEEINYCKCGCNTIINSINKYVHNHHRIGEYHKKITKEKISNTLMGHKVSKKTRIKMSQKIKGKLNVKNSKHYETYSQFYHIWSNMKHRCNNKNCKDYKNYGGRGIVYDPKWGDYLNFKEDMYFKYLYATKQLKVKRPSIERIDVNGNYCFNNCCFIEKRDQNKNTRKTLNNRR